MAQSTALHPAGVITIDILLSCMVPSFTQRHNETQAYSKEGNLNEYGQSDYKTHLLKLGLLPLLYKLKLITCVQSLKCSSDHFPDIQIVCEV